MLIKVLNAVKCDVMVTNDLCDVIGGIFQIHE